MPQLFRFGSSIVMVVIALFGAGCHRDAAPSGQFPVPTVTVAKVEQREVVEYDEFTGRLEAVESVEVRPRVSGYLQEIRFQSGQLVKKGDLLFVIDPRTRKAALDRAEAEVRRAKVGWDNASREAARAPQLLASKAISNEESDERAWKLADAEAALRAAEAARENARLDLEFCEIRSPVDGRVSRALVTVGNNVSGVDGFTTLLTTIVSVDPIYAYVDIDERTLLKFKALQDGGKIELDAEKRTPVELGLMNEEGFPHRGVLESFDNRLDAASGSILLRAQFANPAGTLVPGLFARLRVPGSDRHAALLVSDQAIGTDQNQKFVLTLTPTNTVDYRAVKLGPAVGDKRIVREGLKPGEVVVVNGLRHVRPGMPVKPEMQAAQAKAASSETVR